MLTTSHSQFHLCILSTCNRNKGKLFKKFPPLGASSAKDKVKIDYYPLSCNTCNTLKESVLLVLLNYFYKRIKHQERGLNLSLNSNFFLFKIS